MVKRTIGFRVIPTPWGAFGVVLDESDRVKATFLPEAEHSLRKRIKARWPEAVERPEAASQFCKQVKEYFSGKRQAWKVQIEWGPLPEFRRKVLEACRKVPFGKTASYADLARAVGSPAAARAVGSAMANNPLPLLVPCHRILRSDGSLGGFSSPLGCRQKERLLALENPSMRLQRSGAGTRQSDGLSK